MKSIELITFSQAVVESWLKHCQWILFNYLIGKGEHSRRINPGLNIWQEEEEIARSQLKSKRSSRINWCRVVTDYQSISISLQHTDVISETTEVLDNGIVALSLIRRFFYTATISCGHGRIILFLKTNYELSTST